MKRLVALRLTLATAFAALTLALIARMFWFLNLSVSNALHNDQWVMLGELSQVRAHRIGWSYLWNPYWGHRIVIPRLLLLADERFFHYANAPLILLNVLAQCGSAAILMFTARRLLRREPLDRTIWSFALTANLLLSSLQLENFVYGMAVQYTVAFLSALAAIAFMGGAARHGRRPVLFTSAALACAFLSTLSLAVGLLLWPVMLVEAFLLRANRWVYALLAVTGLLASFAYLRGYSNASMGMGVAGALRHPQKALLIAAMFLGGPFSDVRVWLGQTVGAFGLLLTAYLLFRSFRRSARRSARKDPEHSPEAVIPVAVLLFVAGCAFGVAAGRISPAWLRQHPQPLPSRYLSFSFLFWSAAFARVLSGLNNGESRVAIAGTVLIAGTLALAFIPMQLYQSEQWFGTYRLIDSASSGLFVNAFDQPTMAFLYDTNSLLARGAPYLAEYQLSVFSEPRAHWVGRPLAAVFHSAPELECTGRIESATPVGTGSIRLTGFVAGPGIAGFRKSDLVFTDPAQRIVGLARTLPEDRYSGEAFLGYAAGDAGTIAAWLVEPDRTVCRVGRRR